MFIVILFYEHYYYKVAFGPPCIIKKVAEIYILLQQYNFPGASAVVSAGASEQDGSGFKASCQLGPEP